MATTAIHQPARPTTATVHPATGSGRETDQADTAGCAPRQRATVRLSHDFDRVDLGDPDDLLTGDDDSAERTIEPFRRDRPGHMVIDPAEIRAALRLSGFDGSYEALSSGEEQRIRTLISYKGLDLWRPHLIGSPALLARLDELAAAQPNFGAVTGVVRQAAGLSLAAGTALQIPPVVLVGRPGAGKSRYARGLAEALATSLHTVMGATLPDSATLTGYPPVWRSSAPGRIAKSLLGASTSGPLIFVDECEKIRDCDRMVHPLDRLLALLETSTAGAFMDEHLQGPMKAQYAIFVFGCNSLESLSRPFLDRVITVEVPDLTAAQRNDVMTVMLDELSQELGLAVSFGRPDAIAPLRDLGLRRCRLALRLAIARAVEHQRRFLVADDLAAAVALLDQPESRQSVGFILHRELRRERG